MYTLDTHATVRELEDAGIDRRHAEVIVSAIARADERVATKDDIAAVKAEVSSLRAEIRWMFGFLAALVLAIVARLFGVA